MGRADPSPEPSNLDTPPGLVLGTAGHIDHGKTTLIHALTGVDTDRLPEEKARGITIDLGFAALDLADGVRIAVVDVPGHERLVRTMVSGAAGIDLVLLVVAADEGVMPQTREHVAICDLLGIEHGVVALTKSDLADEEMIEIASEEARELLAETSFANAPVIPVSSQTRSGFDELLDALRELAAKATPHTPRSGPARLPVDRVFAMRGFGTVVTGTLLGDRITVGEAMTVHPGGHRARVRGLQNHGQSIKTLAPGARCAINLQGVEVGDIARGDVIAPAGSLVSTQTADLRVFWLPSAPEAEGTVSIEFLSGTAERRARLAPIGGEGFVPGTHGFARLHIEGDAVSLLPGDRFIARGFARSAGTGGTLGGGVVLDVAPPHRRTSDEALVRELEVFSRADPAANLRERILRTGFEGVEIARLVRETGIETTRTEALLEALAESGEVVRAGAQRWLDTRAIERLQTNIIATLERFHCAEPLRPGMSRGTLRSGLPENIHPESAELAFRGLAAEDRIAIEGEFARLISHRPRLDAKAESMVARIREEACAAILEPPSVRDWAGRLKISEKEFRDYAAYLEREGSLRRAPGDLFFDCAAIEALREKVVAHFDHNADLDNATYKAIIGTTRRTAMPLMELLDDLHVTRRRGDVRVRYKG